MAEEAKVEKKKGGSKLPVLMVGVLMLVMGGFFGLKMKGGGAEKAKNGEDLKLGKEVQSVKEFLVNLDDDKQMYLRTELALQCDESFEKDKFDKNLPVIQDAIIQVLSSQKIDEIKSVDGKEKLKKAIAFKVNKALFDLAGKSAPTTNVHHDGWDSDTGPVLKVYFTSFAFQ